jgi:hypothetical protein
MSEDKIVTRVARELAEGEVIDGLSRRLVPSDLQSLMLHVYRQRSARRTPAELLAQYERSLLFRPTATDARALLEVERLAFESAASFEALELAPVAPIGINCVLGQIDQNNCLDTVRGAEVMADPTTAQALECARRRRAGERGTIKLSARSHQVRLQPFDVPGYSPHFTLFSMVTAGRDRGSLAFEMESLREHLGIYLGFLGRLGSAGYAVRDVKVFVSDTERNEQRLGRARAEVLEPLAAEFPEVTLELDRTREQGRNYYTGLCLRLDATDVTGRQMNLADGGFTDWTRRLLSNAKERLLVSGMGIELIPKRFRPSQPPSP